MISRHTNQYGIKVTADNIMITNGSQQALDLLGKISGAGIPPANDITSGICVIFSNSRMADPFIEIVRKAYRSSHKVCIFHSF
jgi:alanine-alpha-ketoisovalerate/valine-pyruvate aminotransferase